MRKKKISQKEIDRRSVQSVNSILSGTSKNDEPHKNLVIYKGCVQK
jgi:hypothetical protein